MRPHSWNDVLSFTKHENIGEDYSYELDWRLAEKENAGVGKRLARTKSWSGLGKKAKGRMNAKIKEREVRLVDLERLLPARNFSNSLLRKTYNTQEHPLSAELAEAYCYVFDMAYQDSFQILELAGHVNKHCYLIKDGSNTYSSYNAASGEEALIILLRDVIESPHDSLILIDEMEAGLHPSIQRKLADILAYFSWEHKKQFVVTSHSPTLLEAFPPKSRKFIEINDGGYRTISGISPQAALSKMDAQGHPLVRLYCEDDLAEYLIKKQLVELSKTHKHIERLFQILRSGPADMVKCDLFRQKHHYRSELKMLGYCAIIDGDYAEKQGYKEFAWKTENLLFLYPHKAPETFLVESYLKSSPNTTLEADLDTVNKHALFKKMVTLGLAADESDARSICYQSFQNSTDYEKHRSELQVFLISIAKQFSK